MFNPDAPISEFIPLSTHVSPTVIKTTGGDFLLTWRLAGLPFVGREEWDLEHRHNTFNRMLQTLRAPDFVNVAFWVHDVRRRRRLKDHSRFDQAFNQQLSDAYFEALSAQKLMQNELYLTMLYRPVVSGKRFAEKSSNVTQLESEQAQAITTLLELAGNVEAVLKDYAPYRLGMYEAGNGVVFSETGIMTAAPYRVLKADHWALDGTNLKDGDLFGHSSLHMRCPGGASGHETDKVSPSSPQNVIRLAKGINVDDGGAELVYYETASGGAVFSASSIAWPSAILIDDCVSRITVNVLNKFLS